MQRKMRSLKRRCLTVIGVALAILLALPAVQEVAAQANAKIKKQIKRKTSEAMENYDLMEYEDAKRLLNEAIGLAKRYKLTKDKATAKVYLHLGIVYFSGFQDVESAKVAFIDAVEIDQDIEIDAGYKTGEMEKLLADAKDEFGKGGGDDTPDPSVDCDSLMGIAHTLVDSAEAKSDKKIVAHVSADLKADHVSLHIRSGGKTEFVAIKMKRTEGCKYVGVVPGKSLRGDIVHYYIAAYNKDGKVLASKGSSGSPNIIELSAAVDDGGGSGASGDGGGGIGGSGGDSEDPFGKRKRHKRVAATGDGDGDGDGGISKGLPVGPSTAKLFVAVAVGTGAGYVSGTTEQASNDVACCLAPALFHLFPEIGYYLSPQMSISAAFRMGFPVGADMPGHATAAPAFLLRLRKSLDETGNGIQISGALGGGIIRHTVPLSEQDATDTSASGPLLIGAGVAYSKPLGNGSMKFIAELNAIAGIPVISELGTCPGSGCVKPNFALQFDANLGLLFGF